MRGSIVKRAKDSYTLIIPYQDPTTGRRKQHWETVRGTKREADARLGELQRQANAGTLTRPARATLAEYLRAWLTDYCEGHVRATTLRGYRGVIERYIVPHLGGVPLSSLRPEQVQRLYADLLRSGGKGGRGISSLTVQHAHRALSEALGQAVKLGTLGRNVAAQVTPPRVEAQEVQPPSLEAVQSVLQAAKTGPYHLALVLCLVTGARRSEVCGLQWGDLDWKAGTVRIERGIHIVKDQGLITQPPKTRNSRRVVALPSSVVLALRARLERREAEAASLGRPVALTDYILGGPDGRPLYPNTLSIVYRKLARAAGLPSTRLHSLRHVHATQLLGSGAPLLAVSRRLGHSSARTTTDIYGHALPAVDRELAQGFDALLETTALASPR